MAWGGLEGRRAALRERPFAVLAVGDDEQERSMVGDALARGGLEVAWVGSEAIEGALDVAASTPIGGVLLDLDAEAAWRSLEYFRSARPDLPIVVVTDDAQSAAEMLSAGADERVDPSEVDGGGLARALRFAAERRQLEAELASMGLTDQMTGMRNRRGFLTVAHQVLKVAARYRLSVAAVTFAVYDDRGPVHTGSAPARDAIRDFANILRSAARSADVLARTGTSEFTVLLIDPGPDGVARVLDRIGSRVHARESGPRLEWTWGEADQTWGSDELLENLLDRSARAMYGRLVGRERAASPVPGA